MKPLPAIKLLRLFMTPIFWSNQDVWVSRPFSSKKPSGKHLVHALSRALSKELTYAVALLENMRTRSGKVLAKHKKDRSLSFYTDLIRELKDHGIARLEIRQLKLLCP